MSTTAAIGYADLVRDLRHLPEVNDALVFLSGKGGKDRVVPVQRRVSTAIAELAVLEGLRDYTVVFFDMWREQPVFHRFANFRPDREDDPTGCGIATWDGRHAVGTWMPTYHAARIGRPCRKCWPEWKDPLEDSP